MVWTLFGFSFLSCSADDQQSTKDSLCQSFWSIVIVISLFRILFPFLKEEERRGYSRDGQNPPKTTYGASFHLPSPSPNRKFLKASPSPAIKEYESEPVQENQTKSDDHIPSDFPHNEILQGQSNDIHHVPFDNQAQNQYHSNDREIEEYKSNPADEMSEKAKSLHQPMTSMYPKVPSLPASPSNLSLPVGQNDDLQAFKVKRRNKEYNSIKEKVDYTMVNVAQILHLLVDWD